MSYSKELYQQVILDHNKKPRNFREMDDATHACHGFNPLCGDDYTVYLKVSPDNVIEDASFMGAGCAISKSSSSMMTAYLKGKDLDEARKLKIPIIALVDSNVAPDLVDFPIPANDDAMKSVALFTKAISDAIIEGRQAGQAKRDAAAQEAATRAAEAAELAEKNKAEKEAEAEKPTTLADAEKESASA